MTDDACDNHDDWSKHKCPKVFLTDKELTRLTSETGCNKKLAFAMPADST